jgi:hypothetical protein
MQPAQDRNYETIWQWQRQAMFYCDDSAALERKDIDHTEIIAEACRRLNRQAELHGETANNSSFGQQTELARIFDHRNCIWGNLHKF